MSADLVPMATGGRNDIVAWNAEQKNLLRQAVARDCNDAELSFFAQVCAHKDLDPFAGEIVAVKRGGRMIIQETVEGLRSIAERSGLYGGFDGPYWSADGEHWKKVWLSKEPPAAALYYVRRKDWADPVPGVASWHSNVQLDRNGRVQEGPWRDRPDEMLGKVAEVRALRRAFPKEFARAGISTRDLTDAQRVVVEARNIGLDDTGRHALVAEVTNGRTDSTRDLTPDETLEARREIARRQPGPASPPGPAPTQRAETVAGPAGETPGSAEPAGPTTHLVWSNPGPDGRSIQLAIDDQGVIVAHAPTPPDPNEPDRDHLQAVLAMNIRWLREYDPPRYTTFRAWLDEIGLGGDKRLKDCTPDELARAATWFRQAPAEMPPAAAEAAGDQAPPPEDEDDPERPF